MATEADNTSTGVIATIVVVGAFAMIGVSALLAAFTKSAEADLDEQRPFHADLERVAELKVSQRQSLARPAGWLDAGKTKVHMPIEVARKSVLAELKSNPDAASPMPVVVVPATLAAPAEGTPTGGAAGMAQAAGTNPGPAAAATAEEKH